MVILLIIGAALALMSFAFGFMGNFPATPDFIESLAYSGIDLIGTGIRVLAWLMSPPLFFGSIALFFGVMIAEPVYHLTMWILKKIPMLGIK